MPLKGLLKAVAATASVATEANDGGEEVTVRFGGDEEEVAGGDVVGGEPARIAERVVGVA